MARADAILDISGGDSFTDLYGLRRFKSIAMAKRIALDLGKRLILLPQTYGPFQSDFARRIATRIVRESEMAWARDQRSFEVLRALVGDRFDPRRHQLGVDVAFSLEQHEPARELPPTLSTWLNSHLQPTIGFNVSGLIYNDPVGSSRRYSLRADYRQVVHDFLTRIFRESDARVVLIPHVLTALGHYESDTQACEAVWRELGSLADGRLKVLPPILDQSETKWVISKLDWFCGTRMHSTIAGLSSGVPTAAVAYSVKTAGVFETCGQGAQVADPRVLDTQETVDHLWRSWIQRETIKRELAVVLPKVLKQAEWQMDQIAAVCAGARPAPAEAVA